MRHVPKPFGATLLCLGIVLGAGSVKAQYPVATLFSIFPAGGQAGTRFEVSLDGENLDETTEIHFSHPGIRANPIVEKQSSDQIDTSPPRFEITIDADVPPGHYEARTAGKYGISNPRVFQVGRQIEITVKPSPTASAAGKPVEIPVGGLLNGRTTKEKIDTFHFTAKAGQRVLIEAYGRRIDSRADLTLVVSDGSGNEIARCNDYFGRDPFVDFTAPSDGKYQLQVYDFLFQGGNDYFYRLSISTGPKIDFIYPPAGLPGSKSTYTVFGRNLPGGVRVSDLTLDDRNLERIDIELELPSEMKSDQRPLSAHPSEVAADAFIFHLQSPDGQTASHPIYYATAPIITEQEPNNSGETSQEVVPPCEIVGQFNPARDQDWYRFEAAKGDAYFLEVISRRMQRSTDAVLRIQRVTKDAAGKEQVTDVVELDDLPPEPRNPIRPTFETGSSDPFIRLAIPQDGTYRVQVRDVFASSRGGPLDLYRLSIRKATPDFRLIAVTELPITDEAVQQNRGKLYSFSIAPGGTLGINLSLLRMDGFAGEVTVEAASLPTGVTAVPTTIGPGATKGTLVLSAADDAPCYNGTIRVVGRATIADQLVEHDGVGACLVWPVPNFQTDPIRFRLTDNIPLAVNPKFKEVARFKSVGSETGAYEVVAGEKLEIPVMIERPEGSGKLKMIAANLPKDFRAEPLDLENAEGTLRLSVGKTVMPGNYSISLSSNIRVDYSHNPELAEVAGEKAKELSAAADLAKLEAKKLADDKISARKQSEKLKQEIEAARKAHDKALHQARSAKSELKSVTERNAKAHEALRQKPDDRELKKNAASEEEQLTRATEKLASAEKRVLESKNALAQLATKANNARSHQAQVEKASAEADTRSKSAVERSNQAQQLATRLANIAKTKSVYVPFYSKPITVKVVPPAAPAAK